MPVLTLADAKLQLNKTSTADDAELQTFVDATNEALDFMVGPSDPVAVTDLVTLSMPAEKLVLSTPPILSITSLTAPPMVTAPAVADVRIGDPQEGTLRHLLPTGWPGFWAPGLWQVTYQAGRSTVPKSLGLAGRIIVQHMWRTQFGGLPTPREDLVVIPGLGFAIPARARNVLIPWMLPKRVG